MKCWVRILCVCSISLFILCMIKSHECVDVSAQRENYVPDYAIYNNMSMITTHLKNLQTKYPGFIKISDEYVSKNGESQLLTRVSNFSLNNRKEINRINILLAYGEHAREFFPVESLLYFLKNLTSGINCVAEVCHEPHDAFSKWLLSNFDVYIIAMTNPDGRRYIERTQNYCWRGTASGVDLNRNFDWSFGQRGSSSNPKDDEYRGLHAFSEPETLVFQEITKSVTMDAFVSFHSGIRHIYIPFADSLSKKKQRVPVNKALMEHLAERMSKAAPFRPFRYGVASDLTGYFADGTSFDYMSGVKKIPFSFAIEMWQHRRHLGRSCFDEFNPLNKNLLTELGLVHPLYVELFSYLYKWKRGVTHLDIKDIGLMQKPLARFKKDEEHQRLPKRNDDMFASETSHKEESSLQGQLKILLVLTIVIIIVFIMGRQILSMLRKKRVVSIRSLSSTFTMLKNL